MTFLRSFGFDPSSALVTCSGWWNLVICIVFIWIVVPGAGAMHALCWALKMWEMWYLADPPGTNKQPPSGCSVSKWRRLSPIWVCIDGGYFMRWPLLHHWKIQFIVLSQQINSKQWRCCCEDSEILCGSAVWQGRTVGFMSSALVVDVKIMNFFITQACVQWWRAGPDSYTICGGATVLQWSLSWATFQNAIQNDPKLRVASQKRFTVFCRINVPA